MHVRRPFRSALRAATLSGAGLLLLGADGCDVLYRLLQCVLEADCGEVLGDLVDIESERDPPPAPPSGSTSSTPDDALPGASFGESMAAPADEGAMRLAVGAPYQASAAGTTGAVWVFPTAGDGDPVQLVRQNAAEGDNFGASVAIENYGMGALLVVGAPGAVDGGAAFVFENDGFGWTETARLDPPDADVFAEFGASVAIVASGSSSERLVVVGAPGRSDGGRVFVFRRSGAGDWGPDAGGARVGSIQQPGTEYGDRFGACLSCAGDTLAVGVPGRGGYTGSGAASLWRYESATGAWTAHDGFLEPEGLPSQAGFGRSVAVTLALGADRPVVLVGAVGGGYSESGGVVWSFTRAANGSLTRRRFAAGGAGFGRTVAADPRRSAVIVGAPGASDDETYAARVYSPADLDGLATSSAAVRGAEPYLWSDRFGASAVIRRGADGTTVADVGAPGEHVAGRLHQFTLRGTGLSKTAAPKAEPNRYLAFRATAVAPGAGETRITVEQPLRPPFRAELTLGSFSPARRAGLEGGSASFRIDRSAGESPAWIAVRVTFLATGIELRPEGEYGFVGPELRLDGEWAADLAIEASDDTVRLLARPRGSGTYRELANVGAATSVWTPTVSVRGISAGAEIAMDEARIVANAPAAEGAPPAETAAELLRSALARQVAASAALDARDLASASVAASDAAQDLDFARAALEDATAAMKKRPPPRGPAAALRQVRVAVRELAKARSAITKGRRNAQILPRLSKSSQSVGRALAALRV